MTEPTLEQQLASTSHDPAGLAQRLRYAKDSARRVWAEPRLRWFTDHTPDNHSRRIVDLLSQTLEHLQTTPERLQPAELFILLAACYLHDIGMQDLRKSGQPQARFTEADWALVRDEHPRIVKEWIVTRTRASDPTQFRIDIGDRPEPYLETLGLVCQGHGSQFFESTVVELDAIHDRLDGHVVRGALLTALLMMGDELDLNQQRASVEKEEDREPLAELHHTANSYVTSVAVDAGEVKQVRHATLELLIPPDPDLVQAFSIWSGRKLSAQTRRANRVIQLATRGELRLDERVTFRVRHDLMGLKAPLSHPARALLTADVRRGEIPDRTDLLAKLGSVIDNVEERSHAIALRSSDVSDHLAILGWFGAAVEARAGLVSIVSCGEAAGRGPVDVLDILAEGLDSRATMYRGARAKSADGRDEDMDDGHIGQLMDAMVADVSRIAADTVVALDIREIDEASGPTRRVLLDVIVRVTSASTRPIVVMSLRDTAYAPSRATCFQLEDLTAGDVTSHLQRVLGFPPERAAAEAAVMLAVGSGAPMGVISGMRALEARDREVVRA